jgi:hypothetical protein
MPTRLVGWELGEDLRAELALGALNRACRRKTSSSNVALSQTHKEKPYYEFSEACGNLSVRCGPQNLHNLGWGSASRWSAPGPSQRTRREELRALLIVHDEFPG